VASGPVVRRRPLATLRAATTLGTFLLVTLTGLAGGGYFPGAWGWATLGCLWAAALVLTLDRTAVLTRPALAALGLAAAYTGWVALSGLWSIDATQTGLEVQRTLVYVAALLALALATRHRGSAPLRGAWAAVVVLAAEGLLTRLLPELVGAGDTTAGYRLSAPIGYWNALGLLAGLGALLALGLAARDRRPVLRAAAAASLPVLLTTLYFTFSRGAWLALAAGALATLAVDRRRLQLLLTAAAAAPFAAGALALAWHSDALTTPGFPHDAIATEGHRLLWQLGLLAAGAAIAVLVAGAAERRVAPPAWLHRAATASILAAVALALVVAFSVAGSPWSLAGRGWDAFSHAPTSGDGSLNGRLFQLSGNGRLVQWRVATKEIDAHPLLGGGAGSFERWWDGHRSTALKVTDVHSLYLETLAELGPVGLALLCALLAVPLIAAVRARAPLAPAAPGAYVAYLVHAGADWDWEVVAVTLVALTCAASLLVAGGAARPLPRAGRTSGLAAAAVLGAVAIWLLGTRVAVARADDAVDRGDWPAALRDTRRAATLAPWSAEPWRRLGEAQLAARRFGDARASFDRALDRDPGDWRLWLDLAKSSDGVVRANALDRAARLNPLGREIGGYRALLRSLSRLGGADT
jgi:hypothetical protein